MNYNKNEWLCILPIDISHNHFQSPQLFQIFFVHELYNGMKSDKTQRQSKHINGFNNNNNPNSWDKFPIPLLKFFIMLLKDSIILTKNPTFNQRGNVVTKLESTIKPIVI
jgi:hypothetical protein